MLYLCYLCQFKPLRDHLRGFLIAAWAGDKIAEFSFPEISFHFSLRPWFFFVSPAYAGKSRECARGLTRARNHPRMCGEKKAGTWLDDEIRGSPPHVRGKESIAVGIGDGIGITPACAGKRAAHSFQAVPPWDHPRMCGEKPVRMHTRTISAGSPPHVRGKVRVLLRRYVRTGITPACAGKRVTAKPDGACQ